MLQIYYGSMPEAIYNTAMYFNNVYLDKWITDPFSREMIKAVDKAEVLSENAVSSAALGVIPVTGLSGGVKTLILMYNEPDKVFNASTCGDNCAKWILKIAKRSKRDIVTPSLWFRRTHAVGVHVEQGKGGGMCAYPEITADF